MQSNVEPVDYAALPRDHRDLLMDFVGLPRLLARPEGVTFAEAAGRTRRSYARTAEAAALLDQAGLDVVAEPGPDGRAVLRSRR